MSCSASSGFVARVNFCFLFTFFYQLASSCQYSSGSTAFLFSLVNKPGWGTVILKPPGTYNSYQYATYGCYDRGPTFGNSHDIKIVSYASSSTNSYTDIGYSYSAPAGHSYGTSFTRSFLAGSYRFQPDEVEVFYEST